MACLRGNIFSGIRTGDRRVLEERKVDKGELGERDGAAGGQEGMGGKADTRGKRLKSEPISVSSELFTLLPLDASWRQEKRRSGRKERRGEEKEREERERRTRVEIT